MCGLVALLSVGRGPAIGGEELDLRTDALAHRGPDDRGTWRSTDGRVGLGHRRLSILDLSPAGRQPLANEAGSLQLVFNGEIYNFVTLREELVQRGHRFTTRTDSEVILHAWEEWGPGCLERLEGMFAFALWDAQARQLWAVRDRLGIKPLVWWSGGGRFMCASEPGALFAARPQPSRELNPVALDAFMALGSVPAPLGIWKGVHKLLPGHLLCVSLDGAVEDRRWWDLPAGQAAAPLRVDAAQAVEAVAEHLEAAVRSHLVADVPVGAFLSGGIDSSLVVAVAARQVGVPLRTFSLAFPGHAAEDESAWARRVANALGTQHRVLELEPDPGRNLPRIAASLGEPFAVASLLGVHLLSREAVGEVKVVLTGDGGDEVFGGYPRRHQGVDSQADLIARWSPLRRLGLSRSATPGATQHVRWRAETSAQGLRRRLRLVSLPDDLLRRRRYVDELQVFNEAERRALYRPGWAGALQSTEDRLTGELPPFPDRLQRWLYLDLKTTLADEMLTKVDLATMSVGLEARVPLLDHKLVELAFRLPGSLKRGKRLLRQLVERDLGAEVARRVKHGFDLPLSAWLRGPLREQVARACSAGAALVACGAFDPAALLEAKASFEAAPSQVKARQLFQLVWLEAWAAAALHP